MKPTIFSGRGIIQDTTYLMNHMEKKFIGLKI